MLALLARRESVTAVCQRWRVSRQTAYKLRRRFLTLGRPGLLPRTRGRKHRYPDRWPQYRRWLAAHRRRYPTRGASKLRWALRQAFAAQRLPSLRTVERWLQADGLSQVPRRRRRITAQRLQRYRRARGANEVWTIDLKGWCRTGDHAKVEPLTIRDLGSRFILWNQPLPRRNDEAVRRVCRRLFRRHGCPKAIRTDLGAPFCSIGPYRLTSLSLWWYRLNIGVEFVFRRGGIDNNAHEQMHAVLEAATARPPACTRAAQLQRLRRWTRYYNYERPHDGIGGRPPAQRYHCTPAPLPSLLRPRYRPHWLQRKVNQRGKIRLKGRIHHVGMAFAGLVVGCQPTRHGFAVYYHRLRLTVINRRPVQASLSSS